MLAVAAAHAAAVARLRRVLERWLAKNPHLRYKQGLDSVAGVVLACYDAAGAGGGGGDSGTENGAAENGTDGVPPTVAEEDTLEAETDDDDGKEEGGASPQEPPEAEEEVEVEWFYRAPDGSTRGPYATKDMAAWSRHYPDLFRPELPVCSRPVGGGADDDGGGGEGSPRAHRPSAPASSSASPSKEEAGEAPFPGATFAPLASFAALTGGDTASAKAKAIHSPPAI